MDVTTVSLPRVRVEMAAEIAMIRTGANSISLGVSIEIASDFYASKLLAANAPLPRMATFVPFKLPSS